MKLTRTDAIFSRTTMVLFLCRNKSSRNGTNIFGELFYNKRNILEPRTTGGGPLAGHKTPGHPPLARPGGLSPPRGPADPKSNAIKSYFRRKNQGESFIAFNDTKPPPPPVLHWEARSGVRSGLRRGESSVFVITNPPSSPIP
jgi:hypothetical protein